MVAHIKSNTADYIYITTRNTSNDATLWATDWIVREPLECALDTVRSVTHPSTRAVIYAALEHVLEDLAWKP